MKKVSVLVAILIVSMIVRICPVEAFDRKIHEEKDNKAFDDLKKEGIEFSDVARKKVNEANKGQDSPLNSFRPKYHGDRRKGETHEQAFNRIRDYIIDQKKKILDLLKQCKTKDALDELGKALHAIQDFYSHSNFVELNKEDRDNAKAALTDTTKKVPSNVQMCGWWLVFKGLLPPPLPPLPLFLPCTDSDDPEKYSHTNHNKDRSGSPKDRPNDYEWANGNATEHTKEFIRQIWEQLKDDKKKDIKELAYIPFGTTERKAYVDICPAYVEPGKICEVSLKYTGVLALNLTIVEGFPYGIIFENSTPPPTSIDTTNVTMVKWNFQSTEPLSTVEVKYWIFIAEEALSTPTIVSHCDQPVSGYINFHGWITEVDVNGTEYETMIGGDQLVRIGGPPVGGYSVPIDNKFDPLYPHIELISKILVTSVVTVASAIYAKRIKHRKEKQ